MRVSNLKKFQETIIAAAQRPPSLPMDEYIKTLHPELVKLYNIDIRVKKLSLNVMGVVRRYAKNKKSKEDAISFGKHIVLLLQEVLIYDSSKLKYLEKWMASLGSHWLRSVDKMSFVKIFTTDPDRKIKFVMYLSEIALASRRITNEGMKQAYRKLLLVLIERKGDISPHGLFASDNAFITIINKVTKPLSLKEIEVLIKEAEGENLEYINLNDL